MEAVQLFERTLRERLEVTSLQPLTRRLLPQRM